MGNSRKKAKRPQTEMEYWKLIDFLECESQLMWLNYTRGNMRWPKEKILKHLANTDKRLSELLREIGDKFGVIPPRESPKGVREGSSDIPPAPEGKIYYWDWHQKMEQECYEAEYEGLICSACPYSKGFGEFVFMAGRIQCKLSRDSFKKLVYSFSCPFLYAKADLSPRGKKFLQKMEDEFGPEARKAFQAKHDYLKNTAWQK